MGKQTNYNNLDTKGGRKIMTITITALLLIGVLFATSCKKDPQPQPQGKEITVNVKTEGLLIREMTKSFDVNSWVYNYNPNTYELKFQGTNNTYTFNKSIAELKAGFAVSVLPDNYTITYGSQHISMNPNVPVDDKLDITINEVKNINTPSDLTLTAHNDDFLIVVDNGSEGSTIEKTGQITDLFHFSDFTYTYYNLEGDIIINYYKNGGWHANTIPNAQKNNIYHIVSTANGNSTIQIVPFSYNLIGW